jgi:hypothetical protein
MGHTFNEQDVRAAVAKYRAVTGDLEADYVRDGNHYRLEGPSTEIHAFGAYSMVKAIEGYCTGYADGAEDVLADESATEAMDGFARGERIFPTLTREGAR